MAKKNERIVYQREDGKWVNKLASSDTDSSIHSSQANAAKAARVKLKKHGGGELVVHGRDGRIRSRDTYARGAFPPKDQVSAKESEPLVILCTRNLDGIICRLSPETARRLARLRKGFRANLSVSIDDTTRSSFERIHGDLWRHIAAVLLDARTSNLNAIKPFIVKDAKSLRTVFDSRD